MYRHLVIISAIFFATILSCQKKIFKRATITGRLVDSTQVAVADRKVALYGDDATSAKMQTENSIELTSSVSKSDGTFRLSCNASRRGRYYLRVGPNNASVLQISVADNSTKDVGDLIVPY